MRIGLRPQRFSEDPELSVSVSGDTLTINGDDFDFSPLLEGEILPADAIGSDYIPGSVTRTGGTLVIPLLLPHGARAPHETRFPADIIDPGDGPITLPVFERRGSEY